MPAQTWNLKDIIPPFESADYKKLLADMEEQAQFIESYRTKLNPLIHAPEFLKLINALETITMISSRLMSYAYLWYSEDTSNQAAKLYRSQIEQLTTAAGNRILFLNLWFKELEDNDAEQLIKDMPKEYHYYLRKLRLLKPHTLKETEEKIINLKDLTGNNALIKLYDMTTTNFMYKLTVDGKKQTLTREQLTTYVKSDDPAIRKAAYQALYKMYRQHSDHLAEIYRSLILDWKNENLTLRQYKSPITARNKGNDISDKAIQTLLDVCQDNRTLFQDYFKLKAQLCKIDKMSRYDLYTAYKEKKQTYTYEDALKIVYKAYKEYSPEMEKLAQQIVDKDHVHHTIQKNKITGAYCYDINPGITPYVLLNFAGDTRDIFTVAHEFGHAVHDLLSHKHSPLTAHAPLILAETASIFGEMLLFDSFMRETKDKELKKTLLIQQLDNIYASVIRQAYFILYEINAHALIAEGADLATLNKTYKDNLKEQFGDAMTIPDDFQYEWISIPHIFHTPFYCYAYAFGNLLVLALYEQYKKEGKSFVPKYLKILQYGGSESPAKILEELHINIEDPKFWQGGFDLIQTMVHDLKKLV